MRSRCGSTDHVVPSPPSQPKPPIARVGTSPTWTAIPRPQLEPGLPGTGSRRALRGGELVGGHLGHRLRRQHPHIAVLTILVPSTVTHHLGEREEVVDRGHQAGAATLERRRVAPLPHGAVEEDAFAVGRPVHGAEPVEVVARHEEPRVGHPERIEHPFAEGGAEARAAGASDQHAGHVRADVVQPVRTGLMLEWHGSDDAQVLVLVRVVGRPWRTDRQSQRLSAFHRRLRRTREVGTEAQAEARAGPAA